MIIPLLCMRKTNSQKGGISFLFSLGEMYTLKRQTNLCNPACRGETALKLHAKETTLDEMALPRCLVPHLPGALWIGPGLRGQVDPGCHLSACYFTSLSPNSLVHKRHNECKVHSGVPSQSVSQSLSRVRLFATPWTAARQASLCITNSRSLLKPMSITSVMPSNHLILCRPVLLQLSIFPSIRVSSNVLVLRIRWPKNWSFSFSISPSNEYSGLIAFRMDWLDLLAVQGTLKSFLQHHSSKAPYNSLTLPLLGG